MDKRYILIRLTSVDAVVSSFFACKRLCGHGVVRGRSQSDREVYGASSRVQWKHVFRRIGRNAPFLTANWCLE